MTIKALAKKVLENEQGYECWDVISLHLRLFKIFTDKQELHDFLLEYGEFGWKIDEVERDKDNPKKQVIWLKL